MAETSCPGIWDNVLELTKMAEDKGGDPMMWAIQLSSNLNSAGIYLPSPELATLLVSHICWDNNVPIAWKFLEKALMFNIVPPILVLALLSTRIIDSVDNVLHLSEVFGVPDNEPGNLVVEFIFSIVWQLLDASLDDEGLLELTPEKNFRWKTEHQNMDIDGHDSYDENRANHQEILRSVNTVMAIDLIGRFLQNKVTSRILHLARGNMPTHWRGFTQRIQILVVKSSALRNSKVMTPEALVQLISDTRQVMSRECKTSCLQKFHEVLAYGPLASSAGLLVLLFGFLLI